MFKYFYLFLCLGICLSANSEELSNTVLDDLELIPIKVLLEDDDFSKNIIKKETKYNKQNKVTERLKAVKWLHEVIKTKKMLSIKKYGEDKVDSKKSASDELDILSKEKTELSLNFHFGNSLITGLSIFQKKMEIHDLSFAQVKGFGFKASVGYETDPFMWELISFNSSIYLGYLSGKTSNYSIRIKENVNNKRVSKVPTVIGSSVIESSIGINVGMNIKIYKNLNLVGQYEYGINSFKSIGSEYILKKKQNVHTYAAGIGVGF